MENRLDSFGLVPAEISAVEKQISDLKVCNHLLFILFYMNRHLLKNCRKCVIFFLTFCVSFHEPVIKEVAMS